jgi:DNA helicase II / ATP-dependent DNA helicase PcrA
MSLDLNILNSEQRLAVETTDGPLLILAGAGSGKTRVLTYRICHILEQKKCYPEEILAVTFTNKAAGEMKERISHLVGAGVKLPWSGTFHSICVRILRIDGHYVGLGPNFSIYDPDDQLDAVKQAMEELNLSKKDVNPRAIHSFISSAKNEMVGPDDYAQYAKGYFQETVAAVYPRYQKILRENNAVDFDDLLLYVVQLLKQNPTVLAKYQKLFKYILIDEYQDTNHVQYVMVNMLAKQYRNICVVGDDDQSIYAFRGATIKNILNFERDYSDAKVIKLEQNYRSTKNILDAAFEVVSKNKNRASKKLWTQKDGGAKIVLYTAENERDEAEWVARKIKDLISEGTKPTEIAVLYRTNAQSRSLEEGFIKRTVTYRIVGGVRFYERKEIKDILAYLRIVYNNQDDNSLKRVINVPRRGVGPKAINDFAALAKMQGKSMINLLLEDPNVADNKGVKDFARVLTDITNQASVMNVVDLINYILERTAYIKMLDDGTSENEARIENLKELISVGARYSDLEPQASLAQFMEDVSLLEAEAQGGDVSESVTLMTIHSAKGLEYEHVFIVGTEEGLFPHSRVFTDPNELEEERRLAYVAITRAKNCLYLVHAESRMYFGSRQNNMLSRFVDDIPAGLIDKHFYSGKSDWMDSNDGWDDVRPAVEVVVGDRVRHEYFGVGKVIKLDDSVVKIDFGPVYGTKELSLEFAPLQKI